MSLPPQRDFLETEFKELLSFYKEDRQRTIEDNSKIDTAFDNMMAALIGKNDSKILQRLNASLTAKFKPIVDPKAENPDKPLDVSGWDIANKQFFGNARIIDRCHSLLVDVFLYAIPILSKSDDVKSLNVQQPLTTTSPSQPQIYVQDAPGFWSRLLNKFDDVKHKQDQGYHDSMAILNDLFKYMKETRALWEQYRSYHNQNIGKAITWIPEEYAAELFEEWEALDDCRMRTSFLVDAAYRIVRTLERKDLKDLANGILQAKQQSLNQQAMFAGAPLAQQPPNGHLS